MEVHEVVDDSALQVVLDLVDYDSASHIDQLDICKVLLILIDCLVHLLVLLNAIAKVPARFFWILPHVVRRCGLNLHDVGHDDVFGVAFRFYVKGLHVVLLAFLSNPATARFGGIGRIQYCNNTLSAIKP